MTQQEFCLKFQDLKNQIENLKTEYIKSLPFKCGDFVRIRYREKHFEAYIEDLYMPIYDMSGERVNLLVRYNESEEYVEVMPYLKIEDIEVIY